VLTDSIGSDDRKIEIGLISMARIEGPVGFMAITKFSN
jgi:hypothetical protein